MFDFDITIDKRVHYYSGINDPKKFRHVQHSLLHRLPITPSLNLFFHPLNACASIFWISPLYDIVRNQCLQNLLAVGCRPLSTLSLLPLHVYSLSFNQLYNYNLLIQCLVINFDNIISWFLLRLSSSLAFLAKSFL